MRQYLENILPNYFEQSRTCGHERSVLFCGKYIFSYDTCIGVLEENAAGRILYLNKMKYSATTSALQNALREYAKHYAVTVVEVTPADDVFDVEIRVQRPDVEEIVVAAE